MRIEDFDYEFDPALIATEPIEPRRAARLLSYSRSTDQMLHHRFQDLPGLLRAGDCLVFNQTWVLPARFFGQRQTGGRLEFLFVGEAEEASWVWIKGTAHPGERVEVPHLGSIEVLKRDHQRALLKISPHSLRAWLKQHGEIPIPPYIEGARRERGLSRQSASDSSEYQTTFFQETNHPSFAAPTASLHFDEVLLTSLRAAGIEFEFLELQVGEGTFASVEGEIDRHQMHGERFRISEDVWKRLQARKEQGQRIVGVGTTVVRSLETASRFAATGDHSFFEGAVSDLFIRPPFAFQILDGLITNFHFPKTTLLVLVESFLEPEAAPEKLKHRWRRLYEEALRERYRLFSYGDGMMIL